MALVNAFILCSRLGSSRVGAKALMQYNGVAQIEHLVKRLLETGLPVIVAVPERESIDYAFLLDRYPKQVKIYGGFEDDPLARMYHAAKEHGVKNILRVTHDKIFVDTEKVSAFISEAETNRIDYVYSSDFVAGTGFELLSFKCLEECVKKFQRVEHISYAARAVTKNILNYRFQKKVYDVRLLIDFKEDVDLMRVLFASLGTDCTLAEVLRFLDNNRSLKGLNKLPLVTVYTCAYNAKKWIQEAMGSVAMQSNFKDCEYLVIDDHSDDSTLLPVAKFCQNFKNTRFIRNDKNLGLASSSNVALKNARGKYIIRLDADDFFVNKNVLQNMITEIEAQDVDVLYPNCYAGLSCKRVQKGEDNHHSGGALFKTSAINHVKFTDNLRNYDSLDVFLRARDQVKIGYWNRVAFCYRQHNKSMSKNNLEEREKTKKILEGKYGRAPTPNT